MKFKTGDKEPVPKVGDVVYIHDLHYRGTYVVEPCDCNCVENHFPDEGWEKEDCGPHLIGKDGFARIFFSAHNGLPCWDYDGEILSEQAEEKLSTTCQHLHTKQVPLGLGGNCEIITVCCDCGEEV